MGIDEFNNGLDGREKFGRLSDSLRLSPQLPFVNMEHTGSTTASREQSNVSHISEWSRNAANLSQKLIMKVGSRDYTERYSLRGPTQPCKGEV